MEESILTTTKKSLGIAEEYTAFDLDIITLINSAFSTLTQLGIGPAEGFMIEDESNEWEEFIEDDLQLNSVKSYLFLKVKIIFDPPTPAYVMDAMKAEIAQIEWRLNVHREGTAWVDPDPDPVFVGDEE